MAGWIRSCLACQAGQDRVGGRVGSEGYIGQGNATPVLDSPAVGGGAGLSPADRLLHMRRPRPRPKQRPRRGIASRPLLSDANKTRQNAYIDSPTARPGAARAGANGPPQQGVLGLPVLFARASLCWCSHAVFRISISLLARLRPLTAPDGTGLRNRPFRCRLGSCSSSAPCPRRVACPQANREQGTLIFRPPSDASNACYCDLARNRRCGLAFPPRSRNCCLAPSLRCRAAADVATM